MNITPETRLQTAQWGFLALAPNLDADTCSTAVKDVQPLCASLDEPEAREWLIRWRDPLTGEGNAGPVIYTQAEAAEYVKQFRVSDPLLEIEAVHCGY